MRLKNLNCIKWTISLLIKKKIIIKIQMIQVAVAVAVAAKVVMKKKFNYSKRLIKYKLQVNYYRHNMIQKKILIIKMTKQWMKNNKKCLIEMISILIRKKNILCLEKIDK